MSGDLVMHVLALLEQLQNVMDGDPKAFGAELDSAACQEVVEAWEATLAESHVFLMAVRQARGLPTQ